MAVNRVLKENDTDDYITNLLHKFEKCAVVRLPIRTVLIDLTS